MMGIPYYRFPITETDRLVCRVHTSRQTMAWQVQSITTISSSTARRITVRGRLPLHVLEMNMDYNVQYGNRGQVVILQSQPAIGIYIICSPHSYCITKTSSKRSKLHSDTASDQQHSDRWRSSGRRNVRQREREREPGSIPLHPRVLASLPAHGNWAHSRASKLCYAELCYAELCCLLLVPGDS